MHELGAAADEEEDLFAAPQRCGSQAMLRDPGRRSRRREALSLIEELRECGLITTAEYDAKRPGHRRHRGGQASLERGWDPYPPLCVPRACFLRLNSAYVQPPQGGRERISCGSRARPSGMAQVGPGV